jgi:hypothetical protein
MLLLWRTGLDGYNFFGGLLWASQKATGGGIKGTVNTFNDLPAASQHPQEMWVVLNSSRVPLLNWHSKGLYYSDGLSWDYKGSNPDAFYTDVFRLVEPTNNYSQVAFNLTELSATTRTITVPDRDYDLGNPSVDSVIFNTTVVETPSEGKMYWNGDDGTINLGMPGGNVNLQLGQEMLIRAKNTEGSPILNGQAVRIETASSAIPHVILVNNLEELSACTIALATEDVGVNQNGYFTSEGLVRNFNTSALTEGAVVWLGSTDGTLTTTPPTNPSQSIKIGYCIRQHATEGVVYVSIQSKELFRDRQITKEPTGFASSPTLSYNTTNRTITLSGSVEAYYQGMRLTTLVPGWVSPPHNDTDGTWYLFYNGTSFVWQQTPWDFPALQIAFVRYSATGRFGLTEAHGFMPWSVHRHLHANIGTYLTSGGDFSAFVLNSTTLANRRPAISQTNIMDEDNASTLALLNNNLYTQRYLVGAGANITYNVDATDIIPLSGNQPFYNQFTGGAWQQTLFPTNAYGAIFVMAVPVTADTQSQKFRYMFIQPQTVSTTLSDIQNLTPASLNMGESAGIVSEYVFIGKITVRFTAGNWTLTGVEKLTGNRVLQIASTTGNFISAVSTNDNLSGSGIATAPLRLTGKITPTTDSTSAIQFTKADGITQVGAFDTTNDTFKVGSVDSGATFAFEAQGNTVRAAVTSLNAFDAGADCGIIFRGRFTSAGNFGTFGSINVAKETISSGDLRSSMSLKVRNATDGIFDWAKITSNGFVGLKGITEPQNFLHIKTRYNASSPFNGALRIENWSATTFGMIDHIIGGLTLRNNGTYDQAGSIVAKATDYTQMTLGSGLVQFFTNGGLTVDSSFTPTERMRITSTGKLSVGYADTVYNTITAEFKDNLFVTGNAISPRLGLTRFKGTRGGTYSAIVNNDRLGDFEFIGTFSSTDQTVISASVSAIAVGNWSSNTVKPSDLFFSTSPTNGDIVERMRITSNGNIVLGSLSALATNATDGFAYLPTCAGAPTGSATSYTGKVPFVVDTTNNRLYIRVGTTWRYATLT